MGSQRSRPIVGHDGVRKCVPGQRSTDQRRYLSMDASKRYLPSALPLAHGVPGPSLVWRYVGCRWDRHPPWPVLPRLLLDVDDATVRWRGDEPRLGRCDWAIGAAGEDSSLWREHEPADGGALRRMGRHRLAPDVLIALLCRWRHRERS